MRYKLHLSKLQQKRHLALMQRPKIKRIPSSYTCCLVNYFHIWHTEFRLLDVYKLAKMVALTVVETRVLSSEQTRPISLLGARSKLLEKIM